MERAQRRWALAGLVLALAMVPAAPAPAAVVQVGGELQGVRNARYCEVLELHGLPPTAEVSVWNTIGLNSCPAARWRTLDATSLARQLGATLVVLNGPRHFLMDSIRGTTHGRRSFAGIPMRGVAKIKIRTAAELVQRTYGDRTITRDNSWSWKRGRTVFELVAPGGDTYVMQAYAQIKDPSLTAARLPALGGRLALPLGWRYRSRRLARPLTLKANGGAVILQDELQDTYQLATTTRPRGPRRSREVSLSVSGLTRAAAVTGSPFGSGRAEFSGQAGDSGLDGTLRLVYPRGSVTATATPPSTLAFMSGTGAFRGIASGALSLTRTAGGGLTVQGSATY